MGDRGLGVCAPGQLGTRSATFQRVQASVSFRLPSGSVVELLPGDLIGRTTAAALSIDEPQVSEAHALVSLRGGELQLLSLRRMVAVDGKGVSSVVLRRGLVVTLADGIDLTVEAVHLPGSLTALEAPGLGRRLLGNVASLSGNPLTISGRYEPGADVHLWATDGEWRLKRAGEDPHPIGVGDSFTLHGQSIAIVAVPLTTASQTPTRVEGGVLAPLKIVAQFDTVQIHREGRPPLVLNGRGARIVSELVCLGGPTSWSVLASEVWPDHPDPDVLRHRLDVNLARLRSRLRQAGVRADLVHTDGAGQIQLLLTPGDVALDRT